MHRPGLVVAVREQHATHHVHCNRTVGQLARRSDYAQPANCTVGAVLDSHTFLRCVLTLLPHPAAYHNLQHAAAT